MWMDTSAVMRSAVQGAEATIFQAVLRRSVGTRWSLEVRRMEVAACLDRRNRHKIVEFQRLINGGEGMKAVRPGAPMPNPRLILACERTVVGIPVHCRAGPFHGAGGRFKQKR